MVSPVSTHNQDAAQSLIRQAARETGADFSYLMRTAQRESNFDARAEASTSSAAGMFQFIEQTWLGMIDRHGAKHGFGDMAQAISRDAQGRFRVEDGEQRQRILDLRFDASASAVMAGELARENASVMENRIGRKPSSGELYAAHFLGAEGASNLILAADRAPSHRADQLFPQAAAANRPIFYDNGRARPVSDVLERLTSEPVRRTGAARGGEAVGVEPGPAQAVMVDYSRPVTSGSWRQSTGELSPVLVEILASLDAPQSGQVRKT